VGTGRVITRAGIGLRLPHLAEVVSTRPDVGWFEIHPENFLANAHARELLLAVREQYPIAIHTVGISIGSAEGIDRDHLQRLRVLVDEVDPVLVSGHLAWSSHGGAYLNDLLPLPYDDETLRIVAEHLGLVQDALGRQYLVENPSSYASVGTSTMTEPEFLSALVRRTGCRLLCDVSNVYLSAHNLHHDATPYLEALPVDAVGELHLGGFTAEEDEDEPGATLLVDTHASRITDPVWRLYAHAVRRFGPMPTLIEWDNDLPPLATLAAEASAAEHHAAITLGGGALAAC
jgi:uncharacterized protein (UPF0276 family)